MLIDALIQQEDIIIMNIPPPNNIPAKYIKQKLTKLKGKVDSSTVIVGDFSTSVSILDRYRR